MELLAMPGSLAQLPLSCYCPFDKITFFLHVAIKKQDKYGEENVWELQPHKLFRCRFATDGIKGFNNMEQAIENAKLQHCCSCPELFMNCLGAVLSPSDSQTVGHKNQWIAYFTTIKRKSCPKDLELQDLKLTGTHLPQPASQGDPLHHWSLAPLLFFYRNLSHGINCHWPAEYPLHARETKMTSKTLITLLPVMLRVLSYQLNHQQEKKTHNNLATSSNTFCLCHVWAIPAFPGPSTLR